MRRPADNLPGPGDRARIEVTVWGRVDCGRCRARPLHSNGPRCHGVRAWRSSPGPVPPGPDHGERLRRFEAARRCRGDRRRVLHHPEPGAHPRRRWADPQEPHELGCLVLPWRVREGITRTRCRDCIATPRSCRFSQWSSRSSAHPGPSSPGLVAVLVSNVAFLLALGLLARLASRTSDGGARRWRRRCLRSTRSRRRLRWRTPRASSCS